MFKKIEFLDSPLDVYLSIAVSSIDEISDVNMVSFRAIHTTSGNVKSVPHLFGLNFKINR